MAPSSRTTRWFLLAILGAAIPAAAQPRQSQAARPADDDRRLMAELSRRQMGTLLEHAFRRSGIPEEQRKIILTLGSLQQLVEGTSTLSRRQQQELVASVAAGIDEVLRTTADPRRLMEINSALVLGGTVRHLNTLEYWGEDTRTQSQLQPVAAAIDRVYDKVISTAQTRADELEKRLKDANDPRVKEWEELAQLVGMARFNSAFNKYTLALSMDKADARRTKVVEDALAILAEYEDPQYEVTAQVRVGMGKLLQSLGTKQGVTAAREKFAQVLADKDASWELKFQAAYFPAIGELALKDIAAARSSAARFNEWLKANPPGTDELRKQTQAAAMMLQYRIESADAAGAGGVAAREKAVAVLHELMASRPDLTSLINEQLVGLLPDNPVVGELSPMLLKALVGRGDEEIRKLDDASLDRKTLAQALAAAGEILARGTRDGITREDLENAALLSGFFHARLGQDLDAANAFFAYLDKYKSDPRRVAIAFDNALAAVARLRRDRADAPETDQAYLRLLDIATRPPVSRMEYAFEYGRLLLQRNTSSMQGNLADSQKQSLADNARKAAELLGRIDDDTRRLHARYLQMLAQTQLVDLLPAGSAEVSDRVRQAQQLAGEINRLIDAQMGGAADASAKEKLRWFRVRTSLLAAGVSQQDTGKDRVQSLEKALSLLANFENEVKGLPNENTLLGEALFIRVSALMSLRRAEQAMENLGRFLETRSGDDAIRIVYEMLETLSKEFDQAQQEKNEDRMRELAGQRATVCRFLVERVGNSGNPEVRKLLPRYQMFEAGVLQQAAVLEKDPAKKKEYLARALGIFQAAQKASPDDQGIALNIALVQWDLGDYAAAQPVLASFLSQGRLGKPKVVVSDPSGDRLVDNNQYWDAMYRLLAANVALAPTRADGGRLMDDTRLKLKQLYIQWGRPGGTRWAPKFDELRRQILPDWTPPALGGAAEAAN